MRGKLKQLDKDELLKFILNLDYALEITFQAVDDDIYSGPTRLLAVSAYFDIDVDDLIAQTEDSGDYDEDKAIEQADELSEAICKYLAELDWRDLVS